MKYYNLQQTKTSYPIERGSLRDVLNTQSKHPDLTDIDDWQDRASRITHGKVQN